MKRFFALVLPLVSFATLTVWAVANEPPQTSNLPMSTSWKAGYPQLVMNEVTSRGTYDILKGGVTVSNPGIMLLLPDAGGKAFVKPMTVANNVWGPVTQTTLPNGKFWAFGQISFTDGGLTRASVAEPKEVTVQGSFQPPEPEVKLTWGQNMPEVMGTTISGQGTYTTAQGITIQDIRLVVLPEKGGIRGFRDADFQNGNWGKTDIANVPAGTYRVYAVARIRVQNVDYYYTTSVATKMVMGMVDPPPICP